MPGLLGNSPTQSTCTGRVTLVEGQFGSLEWESTSFRGTRSNNRNRCFLQRVGSLLQGSNNWGKMVSPGTTPPYKLSGTVSRSICPQGLHKEQGSNVGPSVDGQYISSTLHHLILASLAKDLWEWCLECQIVLEAQHIPGILNVEQTGSPRSLSTTTIGSLHPCIRQSKLCLGPPRSRSICHPSLKTTPLLCQLETRPRGGVIECMGSRLEQILRLRIPPPTRVASKHECY